MNTVTVGASRSYAVHVGSGILSRCGELIREAGIKPCKAAVISDSQVMPLYGKTVIDALRGAGFEVVSMSFPAGEASKNFMIYQQILEFLVSRQITRSDVIVALGGGVTGDMTGFAAATYLRGVRYVQIPTSLLAMVDSSVGGKTAIDLPSGKNLVGAFCQPSVVVCDLETLSTLPDDIFRDGCAEIIKYGVLFDRDLFRHLEEKGLEFDRQYVVTRCVELKRDVVETDEFDTGERQKLNLGHTVGHGIELSSDFTITHGSAVATGMCIVARAAEKKHICPRETRTAIETVVKAFGHEIRSSIPASALANCALRDKKRSGGTVSLVVPETIGNCILLPTPVEDLEQLIEMGL